MMTARELAEALLALPNPDAPAILWNPGEYWQPSKPVLMQDGAQPWSYALIEMNMVERREISDFCRDQHHAAMGGRT